MMSDSDDEFSDGIVLDDQMLAVLDEEESRFQRATHPNPGNPGPPAKRRKLDSNHPPNLGVFSHSTSEDTEDLPDITVRSDGTYMVESQGPIALAPSAELNGNTRSRTIRVTKPTTISSNNPLGSATSAGRNSITHAPPQQPSQIRRPSSANLTRVPSARVEAQPIPQSRFDSISHTATQSPTDFFDAQLADMRRAMNEVRCLML